MRIAKEFLTLIIGGFILFPAVFVIGVIYTFLKHFFVKRDYSINQQLLPIIRSITLAIDGIANSGAGEILNDIFKPIKIRFGKWYHTISAVTGLVFILENRKTWLYNALNKLEKNHCEEAITEEQKKYYDYN